jgi:aminoglycoside phosphotransferase (APT) family kinase protein
MTTHLEPALTAALCEVLESPVTISNLRQLAGGASKEIWQLNAQVTAGHSIDEHELVLMRQLGGKIYVDALDITGEYNAILAAYATGVAVPRPLAILPDLLGKPAALVERIAGESIGRRIVRDPSLADGRARLPQQLGQALARIHQIDLESTGLRGMLPAPPPGKTPIQSILAQIEADLDRIGEPHPAIELALRWLHRNEPPPPRAYVFVHGDFRIGNIMVAADGLAGILDWEFAHIGDPNEDLVWPLVRDWRFGATHLHFGGISDPEPFFAAYAAAGGIPPDGPAVRYWETLGNVRWALGCLTQAERHLSGLEPNLEFASLGRRSAEMELEALNLIGGARWSRA